MTLALDAQPVPLHAHENGAIRVRGTRVPLDTVVEAFTLGATPEQIVQDYPSLALEDVYGVIAYYLHHRAEVDAYLQERQQLAAEVRRENQARFPTGDLRERLLARIRP
jgi:uncharacterized protein (DUF433 family)